MLQRLERLSAAESLAAVQAGTLLSEFRRLVEEGSLRAGTTSNPVVRSEWTRAALALKRRLDIWEQVYTIASSSPPTAATVQDVEGLRQAYDALAARLRCDPNGESWRRYLLMADAQGQFFGELATDTVACRNLAKRILLRTDYSVLAPSQQAFLREAACAQIPAATAAAGDGTGRLPAAAGRIGAIRAGADRLGRGSPGGGPASPAVVRRPRDQPNSGGGSNVNYRNANLRVSVSQSFLERMLPPPEPVAERVDEVIQGAYTTGCSETLTELAVRLLPSPDCWRIGLVAKGQVAMETQSSAGPATFYSRGNSNFEAAKEVVIHRFGWYHRAAVAEAESCSELADVTTRLDSVPLVGDLARAIAVGQVPGGDPGCGAGGAASRQPPRPRIASTRK